MNNWIWEPRYDCSVYLSSQPSEQAHQQRCYSRGLRRKILASATPVRQLSAHVDSRPGDQAARFGRRLTRHHAFDGRGQMRRCMRMVRTANGTRHLSVTICCVHLGTYRVHPHRPLYDSLTSIDWRSTTIARKLASTCPSLSSCSTSLTFC